jgi:hypothetical protein
MEDKMKKTNSNSVAGLLIAADVKIELTNVKIGK